MSVFGFSTKPSETGDFLPIVKYDSRAGRMFRVDRVDTGNGFDNDQIDITANFMAVADLENVEVGWIDFTTGSAPDFKMVPQATLATVPLPTLPSAKHKNGVRFLLKLHKDCAQGKPPIREIASVAKAFLGGVEQLFLQYQQLAAANPGKLPVIALDGFPSPVKTGSGERSSTNYHPKFKIVAWVPRGDLVARPTSVRTPIPENRYNGAAPGTGSTQSPPPPPPPQAPSAEDFG